MIKIKETDSLIDIIQKIINSKEHEIILNFPFWHPVLHNYLSLKMIKSKAKQKRITILTTDLASKRIWEKLWIYYSIIKDKDFFENKNISQEELNKNFTFWQYFIFEIKKIFRKIKEFFLKYTKTEKLEYISPYDKVKSSSLWLVFLGLFLASFLLVFVFYFAVNKTYVYITPDLKEKISEKNFIFDEFKWDYIDKDNISSNKIPLKLKTNITKLEKEFSTNWVDFESTKKATWKVIFYNELRSRQTLRPKTKIITKDWLIFEATDWIKLPPARYDKNKNLIPWTFEVWAVARIYDKKWEFIWSRWNIKSGTLFTIKNLKNNRDKIYAKAITDFNWWSDDVLRVVWNKDIEKFKNTFIWMIKKKALEELKKKIKSENKQNNVRYKLLQWKNLDWLIEYSKVKFLTDLNKYKPWDPIPTIKINWEIKISWYVYNKDDILIKLKKNIKEKLITWEERLVKINEDSLEIKDIIEYDKEKKLPIKLTMWLKIITSYNYNNNNSSQVLKIKREILWLNIEEAKSILLNDKNISKVKITLVPFFLKHISNISENIIVKIKD